MPAGKVMSMEEIEAFRKAQRADGPATVLATPPNAIAQSENPDNYFRITESKHNVELKEKFKILCEKSMLKKRYVHHTKEMLKEKPKMCTFMAPSLDTRQDIVVVEVPRSGKEVAAKAIKEWGRPKSEITHLLFCTTIDVDMPDVDYQLTKLLGLSPSIKRVMMY